MHVKLFHIKKNPAAINLIKDFLLIFIFFFAIYFSKHLLFIFVLYMNVIKNMCYHCIISVVEWLFSFHTMCGFRLLSLHFLQCTYMLISFQHYVNKEVIFVFLFYLPLIINIGY